MYRFTKSVLPLILFFYLFIMNPLLKTVLCNIIGNVLTGILNKKSQEVRSELLRKAFDEIKSIDPDAIIDLLQKSKEADLFQKERSKLD